MSDDRYALQIQGNGAPSTPYRVTAAFEFDDDDEVDVEDDFLKEIVRFEGVLGSEGFRVFVEEIEPWGKEVKVYAPILGQVLSVDDERDIPLYYRVGEFKAVGTANILFDDSGYQGNRRDQDVCTGSFLDDRFDCKGVYGKRSGVYWDKVSGGLGSDDYVIGRSSRSCYYDDSKGRLETFLYVDDFEVRDRFAFTRKSRISGRYELRAVAGTSYEVRLSAAGLVGVDWVLVARGDRRDILACINEKAGESLAGYGASSLFG
ncbi:MAG: hypothetical protein VKJ44_08235 [Synechococcus sp.]|nr:hypothetical protein [Synechococcus sp.]